MNISATLVKDLRAKTDAGIMECKEALEKCNGDLDKAMIFLREKGIAKAEKKTSRATKEGIIISYIHPNNKIGVLLELNCETDFVAKTEEFKNMAKELSMQIAALSPMYVKREDIPEEILEIEKGIYKKQVLELGKPANVVDKIVEGKLEKFYSDVCLVDQPYMRDDKKKVSDIIKEVVAKTGENINVKRFARYILGGN